MRVIPLTLACIAACPMAAQTDAGIAIRVQVVDSISGNPIAAANVMLDGKNPLCGRTDSGGMFTGHPDASGGHLLTVTRRGYRMMSAGLGKTVEVKAGVENDFTVEMQPWGVIAGRVLDQYGDPVHLAIVRTEDLVSVPGQSPFYQSYSAATTDDRGEYRIAEVAPGKHYLAVEFNSTASERDAGITSRYSWPMAGAVVLYPGATGLDSAEQVEVLPGSVTHLSDVQLRIRRAVTISGRIKPPPGGASESLSLRRADGLALHASPLIQAGEVEPDGSFRMSALPGKYVLTASDRISGKISNPLMLEVSDKDLAGLELELSSGYEISGRITVDGQQPIDFSKLGLNFGGGQVKIDGSGAFRANLTEGTGRYTLQGLPDDWFVESLLVDGKRIEGGGPTVCR